MVKYSVAYLDGWHANKRGLSHRDDDNPYNEDSQFISHMQWLSGWCDRFQAMKHDKNLDLDNTFEV